MAGPFLTAKTPAHREWWGSAAPREEYGYLDIWGAEAGTAWKLFGGGHALEFARLAELGAEIPGVKAVKEFLGLDQPWPAAEEYREQLVAMYPGPPPRPEAPRYEKEEDWKGSPWFHDELFKDGFPTKGVPIPLAQRLFELKVDEVRRREIIERGPSGLIAGAGLMAMDLVVSATDPINLAAMFIPVVGELRAARMIARFGRRGGRFFTGAIEGAVGTAMVEPFVLQGTKMQQADYGMVDSLVAITLGIPLGGGLHVGLGALGDKLARASAHTREAALKNSVARMADGRRPMADQVVKLDEKVGREIAIDETLARKEVQDQVRHAPTEEADRRSADIEQQRVRLMESLAEQVEEPVEAAAEAGWTIRDREVKPVPEPEKAPDISEQRELFTAQAADSRATIISPEMATPEQIAADSTWARQAIARQRALAAAPAEVPVAELQRRMAKLEELTPEELQRRMAKLVGVEARGPYSEMAPGSKEHRALVREAVAAGRTVPEEHLTPYRKQRWAREALEPPEGAKRRLAELEKAEAEALWEVDAAHWKERQVSSGRWEAKFADRYRDIIRGDIKPEIEAAEPPTMMRAEEMEFGALVTTYRRAGSTWPDWATDRGWTKKQVVRSLDKLLAGDKMGRREVDIAHAAVEEARARTIMSAMKTIGHSDDPEMARLLDEYVRVLEDAENEGADPGAIQAAEGKLYEAYRQGLQGARQKEIAKELASEVGREEGVTVRAEMDEIDAMAQKDFEAEVRAFDEFVADDKKAVARAAEAVEEPTDLPAERLDDQYAMDPEASVEADAQLRDLPETTKIADAQRELDDLMSELDLLVEQGVITPETVEGVRRMAADAKVRGDDYAEAIRRAANCLTVRG
ncbi:hypothetical protein LCGC14_0959760 [marine sediment metagenome]|uniref:Uncharacterized protein n=1 Tax=marine sediment metagenome TaxID=412755 RepID=A0A0F9NER9_9ZZZZ